MTRPRKGTFNVYTYKNKSTGDEVEFSEPHPRFGHSPNWALVGEPQPEGVPAPPDSPPGPDDDDGDTPVGAASSGAPAGVLAASEPEPVPEPQPDAVAAPEMPLRNASRQAWADYAVAMGADPASVATAKRDDLIDQYGGE